jgi:TRAP-type C4-dicarboxylate transport system permease small subunit
MFLVLCTAVFSVLFHVILGLHYLTKIFPPNFRNGVESFNKVTLINILILHIITSGSSLCHPSVEIFTDYFQFLILN